MPKTLKFYSNKNSQEKLTWDLDSPQLFDIGTAIKDSLKNIFDIRFGDISESGDNIYYKFWYKNKFGEGQGYYILELKNYTEADRGFLDGLKYLIEKKKNLIYDMQSGIIKVRDNRDLYDQYIDLTKIELVRQDSDNEKSYFIILPNNTVPLSETNFISFEEFVDYWKHAKAQKWISNG